MAETVASVATVGSLAAEYASAYVSYFFHFGKIIEDFKYQRNQLELKKDRVKNDVDEARRQTEVIEKDVQDWLTRAEEELGEAQNLEDEVERSKCFKWCPNWGWRYCLSKKVAKKILLISKLLESSDFPRVGRSAALEGIEFLLSNNFMPSKSSKAAFNGIMDALISDSVNIIGLYGMPGVGKTTLVEEVGKEARKLFDKVVIVTVSQYPEINKIQDEIAEILGLKFKTTTEKGKAEELWRRLKGEKKVLITIDDVWDRLELERIGIPFGDGCKILLTTRRQQVCTQMNCQEKIQLDILSEEEAWTLFKGNASLENASPALSDVAKEVARECKGLPLAIITMGRALKDETLDGWKVVNQRLKDSRHMENQDVCEDIYRSLKISYDYLKGANSRSCLLLCSLFLEDYDIFIEYLTIYGVGQGMFDDVNSIEESRREMGVIVTNLQKSGLLLETSTSSIRTVKMHDVVRDFVHWITSEGENMLVKSGLKEWPRSESFGCCVAISLLKSEINNFPDKLEFPKLKVFFLDEKRVSFSTPHKRVPSMFFQGMKALKVLFLHHVLVSLEALQFLPNLRTLRLGNCELENTSSFEILKKLEILIIFYSKIEEPCYELTRLTTLRLLVICCNTPSKVFILPKYRLSSLVQLEELFVGSSIEWAISEADANKASLAELHLLPRLTKLSLQVRSECIPKQFVFPRLRQYIIAVNDTLGAKRYHWFASSRCLTIKKFSLNAFKELYCNVEELVLSYVMDLEYLIDAEKEQGSKSAFSNLVKLTLNNMTYLKELCHGLPPIGFLQKLETLTVKHCSKLVLAYATVQNLKELTVKVCQQFQVMFQMDGVVRCANEEIQTPLVSSLTSLHLVSLPKLRSIWEGPTHHVSLRNLKFVKVSSCDKLTSFFSLSLAQTLLYLERLEIFNCKGLEQVFGNVAEETNSGQDILLPQLQFLALEDLANLTCLCSKNYFVMLPSLRYFRLQKCLKLTRFSIHQDIALQAQSKDFLYASKDMICCSKNPTLDRTSGCRNLIPDVDQMGLNGLTFLHLHNFGNVECLYEATNHRQPSIAFSNLVELAIEEMIGLKKVCNNQPPKGFLQKLENLKITNCMNLVSLSPLGQNLKKVMIESCGQLQEIFQVDEVLRNMETNQAPLLMSNLTSLELKQLSELRCIWKGPSHFVINLQSLKIVKISNCNRLKCLFFPSLVKSLVQLEELILHDLPELEQLIMELESDVEQQQQVFNMVKEKVNEQHKPFLPLMLPSLKKFIVFKCPRLTPFVIQQEVNNQPQVKGLYLSNQQCNSFDILLRQSLPNLEHGIVGNHLQFLQQLTMSNCNKLKRLFSPMLAESLPHLSYLHIEQCKELEQIIDEDKTSASSSRGHLQPICFPSLNGISIEECNNLKCLFSVSVAYSLPQLQWFIVRGASELEQVFEYHGGIGIEDIEKEIVFRKVKKLSLEGIPKLKSFIPMGYHCSFPLLFSLKVEECPNLTTSFSIDSKHTIHARIKAAGDAPMKGSATNVDLTEIFAWPVGSDINLQSRRTFVRDLKKRHV